MKKIIITAGGTSEKIDNVRKITNSSTGKLGMIIANQIIKENNDCVIYYICSKNSLRPNNKNIKIIEIEGTSDLKSKIECLLLNEKIDVFIHSMAVSDYTTDFVTTLDKLKKELINSNDLSGLECFYDSKIPSNEDNLVIVLKPTPKIISLIKKISPKTYLVGFKLLDNVSKDLLINVAKNLRDKNHCDLVVANDLNNIRDGKHLAYIIDNNDAIEEAYSKDDIAKKLVKKIF